MQTCPKMQRIIEQIAAKHTLKLTEPGARLRLDLPGYDRLCIEVLSETKVSVAHFYDAHGYLIPEPDVVFYTGDSSGWIPIELTQSLTGCSVCAVVTTDEQLIAQTTATQQWALAVFCEQWAQHLTEQGWLDAGIRHGLPAHPTHRFGLGLAVITPGALTALEAIGVTPQTLIDRHVTGDWGNLDPSDYAQNELAVERGGRIFSAYTLLGSLRVWVITEADRSVTTVLLPSEY